MNSKVAKRYSLSISLVLLLSGIFFQCLPFFLDTPLPSVFSDSFDYFWIAKHIYDGDLPVTGFGELLPVGYPLFLALTKFLSLSWVGVTALHVLAYASSSAYLCYAAHQLDKRTSIFIAIACLAYLIIPSSLNFTFSLYTESLYTSSMIFLAGSLVHFSVRKNLLTYTLLCIAASSATLLRSNGILFFAIPLLILLLTFLQKKAKKAIFSYSGILISFVLLNASINLVVKGKFMFGDLVRFTSVVLPKNYANKEMKHLPKTIMYQKYWNNFSRTRSSYFFDIQEQHFDRIVGDSLYAKKNILFCDKTKSVDQVPGFRQFVFEGMPELSNDFKSSFKESVDIEKNNSTLTKLANHPYHYLSTVKLYPLIFWIFWILFSINSIRMVTGTKHLLYSFLVAMIYVAPLLLLPLIHPRFVDRYITVSEFVIFIYIALTAQDTFVFIRSRFLKTTKVEQLTAIKNPR